MSSGGTSLKPFLLDVFTSQSRWWTRVGDEKQTAPGVGMCPGLSMRVVASLAPSHAAGAAFGLHFSPGQNSKKTRWKDSLQRV